MERIKQFADDNFFNFIILLVLAVFMVSYFQIFKSIENDGGLAKSRGKFVADFECARENNCPTN